MGFARGGGPDPCPGPKANQLSLSFNMNCHSKGSTLRPTCLQTSAPSPTAASDASVTEPLVPQIVDSETTLAKAEAPVIYAVDDDPGLTELYRIVLNGAGYQVKVFNYRTAALAALILEQRRPDLLITDYCGPVMPVCVFLQRCLIVHPTLRILMASGFNELGSGLCPVRPHRFLQKPFAATEFLHEIKAAFAA